MPDSNRYRVFFQAMPFVRILVVSALFVYIGTYASLEISDLDVWLHVKCGEVIVNDQTFLQKDLFSFTRPGAVWINHEWLSQVILYSFFSFWHDNGLVCFKMLAYLCAFALLYLGLVRRYHFLLSAFLVLIAFLTVIHRLVPRPDIMSFLFVIMFIVVLDTFGGAIERSICKSRLSINPEHTPRRSTGCVEWVDQKKKKLLWLLPVIQLFWVNMHGFFILGIGILFAYWCATVIQKDRFCQAERHRAVQILLICIAVCLINPNGLHGALYPLTRLFSFFSGKESVTRSMIMELRNPFQEKVLGAIVFKTLFFTVLFSYLVNRKRINVFYGLLTVMMALFASSASRNIHFFGPIGVLALADNSRSYVKRNIPILFQKISLNAVSQWAMLVGSVIFVGFVAQDLRTQLLKKYTYSDGEGRVQTKKIFWGYQGGKYPEAMRRFVDTAGLPERMFNSFNIGSYLIGNCYPRRKVFVDGRTEFYGERFMRQYRQIMKGDRAAIQEMELRYAIEGFILDSRGGSSPPLLKYLLGRADWVRVYHGRDGNVFVQNTPRNRELIQRYTRKE